MSTLGGNVNEPFCPENASSLTNKFFYDNFDILILKFLVKFDAFLSQNNPLFPAKRNSK